MSAWVKTDIGEGATDIRFPQKQTSLSTIVMSALCHKQTFWSLFDMIDSVSGKKLKFAGYYHEVSPS